MSLTLHGMTWSHPRGSDPLIAASKVWRDRTGVEIAWDQRSLQDFESYPVEELARRYDLIVIDHPHVGQITAENCLLPLDVPGREPELEALASASVGPSFESYTWQGRQWALPIDAATQIQAWRPDLIEAPAATWSEMLKLARAGQAHCPMRPPHSLMTLYTLAANLGRPADINGSHLFDVETGIRAIEMIRELVELIDSRCYECDPIAVFEEMSEPSSRIACVPLIYGYVSYSRPGFRPSLIRTANIPAAGTNGLIGSALGGTGMAVSAFALHSKAAFDFAYWIASEDVQSGIYATSGGQPGHLSAWLDEDVNQDASGFYIDTLPTLKGAWLRPRHNGYMAFQHAASLRLNQGLVAKENSWGLINLLNDMFSVSFIPT